MEINLLPGKISFVFGSIQCGNIQFICHCHYLPPRRVDDVLHSEDRKKTRAVHQDILTNERHVLVLSLVLANKRSDPAFQLA